MKIIEVRWEDFVKEFPSATPIENATYFYSEEKQFGAIRNNDDFSIVSYSKSKTPVEFSPKDDFDFLVAVTPSCRRKPVPTIEEHIEATLEDIETEDEIEPWGERYTKEVLNQKKINWKRVAILSMCVAGGVATAVCLIILGRYIGILGY